VQKKSIGYLVGLTLVFTLGGVGHADGDVNGETRTTIESTLPVAAPTWKASVVSSFVDMHGTEPADNNAYSFGAVRFFTQVAQLDYALAPDWNLSLRTQYLNYEWLYYSKTGQPLGQHTDGVGDSYAGASHAFISNSTLILSADAGVSLPSGSIDQLNPYATNTRYSYRMQLGSGTFDGVFGLNSLFRQTYYNLGSRLCTSQRTGVNDVGYRLGNNYRADAWLDVPARYGLTPRLVGFYQLRNGIPSGADPTLNRIATDFYFHNQIMWNVSAALKYEHPLWQATSLSAEIGVPVAQGMINHDHIVVSTDYYSNLSLVGKF
jgi:hypothetical protein